MRPRTYSRGLRNTNIYVNVIVTGNNQMVSALPFFQDTWTENSFKRINCTPGEKKNMDLQLMLLGFKKFILMPRRSYNGNACWWLPKSNCLGFQRSKARVTLAKMGEHEFHFLTAGLITTLTCLRPILFLKSLNYFTPVNKQMQKTASNMH